MFNQRKVTFIPLTIDDAEEQSSRGENKLFSVLESEYWQAIGWVHAPPFLTVDLPSNIKIQTSNSAVKSTRFYTQESLEPKLQIEDKVPYGVLPKDVVVDIEKRRFARQDFKIILCEMGIEKEVILPFKVMYKEKIAILRKDSVEGIPQEPFLDLDLFDDAWYYDAYSPKQWLSLGDSKNGRKPLPALAFAPNKKNCIDEPSCFDWFEVSVLDYDGEKKLYLIRKNNYQEENDLIDLWVPRIYLKFDAEEPFYFAKRLHTALTTRHMIEESLRINYYLECIPIEGAPEWPQSDLDGIEAQVRQSRQLQPKLQWIKDHLQKSIEEIKLEYKRAFNYTTYVEIAKQTPCLLKDFRNENLSLGQIHSTGFKVQLDIPFKDRLESLRCNTLYTGVEVVRTLILVETNILALRDMSLYKLPLKDIYPLEKFEALQITKLENIKKYIHHNWIADISNAILLNLEKCGKGPYDLNQTVQHTFRLTKLGKLLKMIMFKMQDVIRFLVMESLEKYATMIQEACQSVMDVKDNYKWNNTLSSNKLSPLKCPIFEVPLEIKGDRLQFVVDLKKYGKTVRDLFQEGLEVTKDLSRLEKFVMKKILYNPDDKLDTVSEKEKQIVHWKMDIIRGMDRAMTAATAYIRAYDDPLKLFKTDQINYVKQFARKKTDCDQLKQVIEMHNVEKKKLENTIPSFLDIGPFRLLTKNVRTAAIKKHEQLADAVLGHFYGKLNQFMESIKDQFLVLHDRIRQPTGNIEDLLDKKQWCRTVPKKIEKFSSDVNKLRSDFRLISTFHRNMEDEDFNTFWQVQKFPQISMKMLQNRISTFDAERNEHKEHLSSDMQQLKSNLDYLQRKVTSFVHYSDADKASAIATEIRKARKDVTKYDEQSQLYQKRERLFGLAITEHTEIAEISDLLIPYENFWLSAAEFYMYKERELSDLLSIDPSQLRGTMEEFRTNLQASLTYFTRHEYPEIHVAVISVLSDIEEFINTKLV